MPEALDVARAIRIPEQSNTDTLNLSLLGLNVSLDDCNGGPVQVCISASRGEGLLGDLLCGLSNADVLNLTLADIATLLRRATARLSDGQLSRRDAGELTALLGRLIRYPFGQGRGPSQRSFICRRTLAHPCLQRACLAPQTSGAGQCKCAAKTQPVRLRFTDNFNRARGIRRLPPIKVNREDGRARASAGQEAVASAPAFRETARPTDGPLCGAPDPEMPTLQWHRFRQADAALSEGR